ncbi:uncharacterized protein K460DRAFT_400511 [Cucurbitaria berberidis CBS 394.84]|uniref:F-box domain-containing protein n=1 Tax=Cucurbitaria berberidis CBS 394.84 TaxID=1168544 RepID=A0A9P4LC86_9PLEO|nr:uncharacterized protein K460DRAFT_400511 [Cucurbitaria berberidis CBS 394.84]KAF1850446.1 hypothetical protein K460DRAFT_400511 [Cucurbitaria berberidis CBS 394.84]
MTQTSPLLTLPGELRNYIVEYAFRREPGTTPLPLSRSQLALPFACRQLHRDFQALARSLTIFSIRWSSAQELRMKADRLLPASRASITKLQLEFQPNFEAQFVFDARRKRVTSFDFAGAGLTGLQELYFRYPPSDVMGGVGVTGREFLMLALWKILWERGNDQLRKVCAVHDGAQPYLCLTLLYGMMKEFGPLKRSNRWKLQPDLDHGQVHFLKKGHDGKPCRQVTLVVGYSFREAEEYCAVREQLHEGKQVDIITARRTDCAYAIPFHELSDHEIRCELLDLSLLFRGIHEPILNFAPRIEVIRSMSEVVSHQALRVQNQSS